MKDIHAHLSGSTSYTELWGLIKESGYKTHIKNFHEFVDTMSMKNLKTPNLSSYLQLLHRIDKIQSSPNALCKSTYDAFMNAYLGGCSYLELRWNPYKRSNHFEIDMDSLIAYAISGMERAKSTFGIEGQQILCLGTDIPYEGNAAILKKAIQYKNRGIIGIDTAGPATSVDHYKSMGLVDIYNSAQKNGLVTTCHIGETPHEGEEDEMAFVLEKLQPNRIGHGIQIVKYPKLLKRASSAQIHFEICMTSNIVTKAVEDINEFKQIFKSFEENAIGFTICTDAMYPLSTNIRKEHDLYKQIIGG